MSLHREVTSLNPQNIRWLKQYIFGNLIANATTASSFLSKETSGPHELMFWGGILLHQKCCMQTS